MHTECSGQAAMTYKQFITIVWNIGKKINIFTSRCTSVHEKGETVAEKMCSELLWTDKKY